MENLQMPRDLDVIAMTHSHTDHSAAVPQAESKNPTAKIFAPE